MTRIIIIYSYSPFEHIYVQLNNIKGGLTLRHSEGQCAVLPIAISAFSHASCLPLRSLLLQHMHNGNLGHTGHGHPLMGSFQLEEGVRIQRKILESDLIQIFFLINSIFLRYLHIIYFTFFIYTTVIEGIFENVSFHCSPEEITVNALIFLLPLGYNA